MTIVYEGIAEVERPIEAPEDEACAGCHYARGCGLIGCTHPQSPSYQHLVFLESWCPQFVPHKE